jgi:hypothetical protein
MGIDNDGRSGGGGSYKCLVIIPEMFSAVTGHLPEAIS